MCLIFNILFFSLSKDLIVVIILYFVNIIGIFIVIGFVMIFDVCGIFL